MNNFLKSSLGKKVMMACTGLFLALFLVEHLYTNVHIYFGDGGKAFNEASHDMVRSIIIRIIEVVLFLAIVLHVIQALILTGENSKARPVKYAVNGTGRTSSWFSRNMLLTGSLVFFFIVVHLYNFFVPYRVTGAVHGPEDPANNLALSVVAAMGNPYYAGLYLVSVLFLAFHLNHGFQSAFQSLGVNNKKYAPLLKVVGSLFAFGFVGVGFGSFPVIFYLGKVMHWNVLYWNMPLPGVH